MTLRLPKANACLPPNEYKEKKIVKSLEITCLSAKNKTVSSQSRSEIKCHHYL